jgi:hypothetical protein
MTYSYGKEILNLNHVRHLQEKTQQLKSILHEFEDLKQKYIEEKSLNEEGIKEKMQHISMLKNKNIELSDQNSILESKLKEVEDEL